MAPSTDAAEDTLVTLVQHALAAVYEDRYPHSNKVQQGLEKILNQRYDGSREVFTNKFVRPTISLLDRLKTKGFPLVKRGKVIVHLLAPSTHLESGEMFYQVGHTTPGTLALKFTKYQGSLVVLQPSTIDEKELHVAFSQQYIEKLRNGATRTGDQLMRILLTSTENGKGLIVTEKMQIISIMPIANSYYTSCSIQQPVVETGLSKWPDASNSRHFAGPDTGHQPEDHSSSNQAHPPILLSRPDTRYQSEDHSSVGGRPGNPTYPLLLQAVRDDPPSLDTDQRSEEQSSGVRTTTPAYPPLVQAVRENPSGSLISHQSEEQSSVAIVSRESTAKNDLTPPVTETNLRYADQEQLDPLHHILLSCKQLKMIQRQHSLDANLNNNFELQREAIQHILLSCKKSGNQSEEHLTNRKQNKPAHPTLMKADSDNSPTPVTGNQSEENFPFETSSIPAYPFLMQAVRDDLFTSLTRQQSDEHS